MSEDEEKKCCGNEHEHEHSHGHEHGHSHEHGNETPEERLALLKYMLSHNAHHAEELHELAHGAGSEASGLIHDAVSLIEQSNEKLKAAIGILDKQ